MTNLHQGNYFIAAIQGERVRHQILAALREKQDTDINCSDALMTLVSSGIYDHDTDLYWVKVPAYIPETSASRQWESSGGDAFIDRCQILIQCRDGQPLETRKGEGEGSPPEELHNRDATMLVPRVHDGYINFV